MATRPRLDAQVANIAAATAVVHDAVTSNDEFLLDPRQLRELQEVQLKIALVLYMEMGDPAGQDEDQEGEKEIPPSLDSDLSPGQEQARLEGEARDELNELPDA